MNLGILLTSLSGIKGSHPMRKYAFVDNFALSVNEHLHVSELVPEPVPVFVPVAVAVPAPVPVPINLESVPCLYLLRCPWPPCTWWPGKTPTRPPCCPPWWWSSARPSGGNITKCSHIKKWCIKRRRQNSFLRTFYVVIVPLLHGSVMER